MSAISSIRDRKLFAKSGRLRMGRHRSSELIVNEVHWAGIDGHLHPLPEGVVKIRGRAAARDGTLTPLIHKERE